LNEYWNKLNLFRIQKKGEEIREKVATATVAQKQYASTKVHWQGFLPKRLNKKLKNKHNIAIEWWQSF
jgi:hypothetical protein